MGNKSIFHGHLGVGVNDVALLVAGNDKFLEVGESDGLHSFVLVHGVDGVSEDRRVPCEDVAIGGACDQSLAFFHPLDGEQRVLLLVHRFRHKLRGSRLPVRTGCVIHV